MSHAKRRIVIAVTLAEHGGVQEFLVKFARFLIMHGHTVTLLAGEGSWLFEACGKSNIPIRRLHHMRRSLHPWHDVLAIFELRKHLHELRPDVLSLHSSKMGALGSFTGRFVGIPKIVYRIGGWVFLEPLSIITRWLYRLIETISARWKDVIVCVHPGDADIARTVGILPKESLRIIPNGIDLEEFDTHLLLREKARRHLQLTPDTFVFGTLANLFPAKDLSGYLDACALIHHDHPQARFLIIGDGPERTRLELKRDRLGLTGCVLFFSRQERASRFLRAFDAFILPSAKEGMSWALLEAMAAGLPCLATDVGAHSWLLHPHAGWIVPAKDPPALAQRMKYILLHAEERIARGEHARKRIERDFPLKKTLQDNENALDS